MRLKYDQSKLAIQANEQSFLWQGGTPKERTYCIYCIKCIPNGKRYIGMTTSWPVKRLRAHTTLLRRGIHGVEDLQADFQQYGEDAFEFRVIEEGYIPKEIRLNVNGNPFQTLDCVFPRKRERHYIKELRSFRRNRGYNYKDWCHFTLEKEVTN